MKIPDGYISGFGDGMFFAVAVLLILGRILVGLVE